MCLYDRELAFELLLARGCALDAGAWNCAAKLSGFKTERSRVALSMFIEFHAFAGIGYKDCAPPAEGRVFKKSPYARNMTEGLPFTFIGLKDAGNADTALKRKKVQLSYD
jgi:hypothetical protein